MHQYPSNHRFQNARFYTPSSRHQLPKSRRYALPPAAPPKSRKTPSKVPQARRQTDLSQWSWSKSRWHNWAIEHKYIIYSFVFFVCGSTIFCSFSLQRVPITGRMQLDLIPKWVAKRMEKSELEKDKELRKELTKFWFESDHPGMQQIDLMFSRLVRASGLDDRDWEVRIVRAPSE